jgi:peptide/nickel transport system substrate-binding protein
VIDHESAPPRGPLGSRWRPSIAQILIASSIIVVIVVVALLARRSGDPAAAALDPTLIPEAGGSYTEGVIGVPATLNPLLAQNQSEKDVAALLFDGLIRVDASGRPQPGLAKTWSASADARTYTFELRPDARWHDGKPVTAQDVVFTVHLIQDADFPGDPELARFWRAVSVQATDERTVTFKMLQPFAPFANYAAVPILPKHLLGGTLARDLADAPYSKAPIDNGPFQVEAEDSDDDHVTVTANPDYYGGRPYLDQVTFQFYQDSDELISALRGGDVQGAGFVPL